MRNQLTGSATDYVNYGEQAATIAAETGDPALRAGIGTLPAFGHMFAGNGREALRWVERVLEDTGSDNSLGKEISGYSPRASMFSNRANALMYLGRLPEAWDAAREAARVAEETQELEVLGWAMYVTTWISYTCGGGESVLPHARRSLEIAENLDNESSRTIAYGALGFAYLVDGQHEAARDAFLESIAISRDRRSQLAWISGWLGNLSEAHLILGERDDALVAAREGIAAGRADGGLFFEAQAHLALAAALLETDGAARRAEIEGALDCAGQLIDQVEGRALMPRLLEMRGRLADTLGDSTTAEQLLREALDLYGTIGATGHAERLGRALGA
jgi:tetratricopeptide (TPR) repeat protein